MQANTHAEGEAQGSAGGEVAAANNSVSAPAAKSAPSQVGPVSYTGVTAASDDSDVGLYAGVGGGIAVIAAAGAVVAARRIRE